MNRLTVSGENLDLGDARISIRRTNPMFEDVGSYSLPFSIPRTKRNEQILKLNNAAIHSGTRSFDAIIYVGPIPIYGELVITDVYESVYETYFTTGNSTFRSKVQNIMLNDLDYTEEIEGSAVLSFTEALTTAAKSSYPTYNYTCFPMMAPDYYDTDVFFRTPLINPWSYNQNYPDQAKFVESGVRSFEHMYAPSFYLCFVIQKIFDLFGYSIENNEIYDDAELRTLVIANVNTLGLTDTTFKQYDLKFSKALPQISISEFISSLEKLFNVTFFISEESKIVNIKKNTPIIKGSPLKKLILLSRALEKENILNGFKLSYTMDPNDSFSRITPIDRYELGLTVDNKTDLTLYDNRASEYPGQLAYVSNNSLYYVSKIVDESADTWEWQVLTQDFFDYIDDQGEYLVETSANPILTDNDYIYDYADGSGDTKEYAIFPRVGITLRDNDGIQEYTTFETLRLLFYRGVINGGGGVFNPDDEYSRYPLASSDVFRAKGLSIPNRYGIEKISSANMSLRWDGTYGLYNSHYKDYMYWYINLRKKATDVYHLSVAEIFQIKFFEKYQADGVSVLFRSMELEIDFANDTVTAGKCEVYIS
jgi:hypothetical protein